MLITTKLAEFGSIDFPDNFCQEIRTVLGTRIRKCLPYFEMPKMSRHFLILELETAMISWQKLSGKSMEPNAARFVVVNIGI